MDIETAHILNQVTQDFYVAQANSFSATRQSGWPGWQRVLHDAGWLQGSADTRRVLDVACGNMRFKNFLDENAQKVNSEENTPITWDYWAVDSCLPLVGGAAPTALDVSADAFEGCAEVGADCDEAEVPRAAVKTGCAEEVSFVPCDVVSVLLSEHALPFGEASGVPSLAPAIPPADMTACFGFFHHVSGQNARIRLLRALCSATRSGGVVALSLWRFMDNPTLAQKAFASHEAALKRFSEQGICLALDEGDYLLGWQRAAGTFRYCHHFSDEDVDELVASVADRACLIDRFRADGRTGDLNEYLVFRAL